MNNNYIHKIFYGQYTACWSGGLFVAREDSACTALFNLSSMFVHVRKMVHVFVRWSDPCLLVWEHLERTTHMLNLVKYAKSQLKATFEYSKIK